MLLMIKSVLIDNFVSEPNIEAVVNTDDDKTFKKKTVSYSNRQLIAREIEMEKMRRFHLSAISEKNESSATKSATTKFSGTSRSKSFGFTGTTDNANLPNHLQTLKAKTVKVYTPVSQLLRKNYLCK